MRGWILALLALLVAMATPVVGQSEFTIPAGYTHEIPLDVPAGYILEFQVAANASIDVLLVQGGGTQEYFAGNATLLWASWNVESVALSIQLDNTNQLFLLIDNSVEPEGGATGTTDVSATVNIVVREVVAPAPPSQAPERSLWRSLMFTADYWDAGIIGVAGIALWLLIFAAIAAYRFDTSLQNLATLGGGAAGLTFLWALIPHPGMITQVGLPMLIGAAIGYLAAQGSKTFPSAIRFATVAAVLGALLGLTAGHFVHGLWANVGMLVLGMERFTDALFTVSIVAVATAAAMKFVPALVEALEDDEATAARQARAGQGETINVACLRCATPISVDRSVKRFRVATDHVEFSCPNCHVWMEWSNAQGTAALRGA